MTPRVLVTGATGFIGARAVAALVSRGADLNAKDAKGNTPVDSALGKAGGNSRGGARIDIHEDTATLLKKLMAQAAPPANR